jgi:putative FmdB family regulatory protein
VVSCDELVMPIWEYSCRACGQQFEALVRGSETPSCPACNSQDLNRLISVPAVKSESTRQLALQAAKKRDAKRGSELARAQREYELRHND